jgi:hypothetical protein
LICGGLLAEPFKTDLEGDRAVTNANRVAPLAAVCGRLEADMCERVEFTKKAPPKVW